MSLDKNNTNPAYLCGRLFAVLEKIQQNASDVKLNRTVKDSYFSLACSNPCEAFPRLFELAHYHLRKDKYAIFDNNLICEIIDKLDDSFPAAMSMVEQGKFIIGYYQQVQSLYEKSDKSVKKPTANAEKSGENTGESDINNI